MFCRAILLAAIPFLALVLPARSGEVRKATDAPRPARTDRYGDPLPQGAIARMGTLRWRHGDPVGAVAFSPDGRTVVSAGGDRLRLWDAATGRQTREFGGHDWVIRSSVFSPDGKLLAAGVSDNTVRLWDVATGKESRCLRGHGSYVEAVAFSPDGNQLASAGRDDTVRLWDVATSKEVHRWKAQVSQESLPLAFSQDGKTLIAPGEQHTIRLWDLATGGEVLRWRISSYVTAFAIAPGSRVMATAGGPDVLLWETATGRKLRELKGRFGCIWALAFSPDGKLLASGDDGGTVRLWDLATGKVIHRCSCGQDVACVAFSPDGKLVAAAGDVGLIHLRQVITGQAVQPPEGHRDVVTTVAFPPDGRLLLTGSSDKTIRSWEVSTGREVRRLDKLRSRVGCLAIAPGGAVVAWEARDLGHFCLQDITTGKTLRQSEAHEGIDTLAFSADGKLIVSGGGQGKIQIWDRGTGKRLRHCKLERGYFVKVALSPDGRTIAAASRRAPLCLVDAATATKVRKVGGWEGRIGDVAFGPDGRVLATTQSDGPIELWDVARARRLFRFEARDDFRPAAVLSSDGKTLATANLDGSVELWEVATGKKRQQYLGHRGAVMSVAFSPDGRTVASASCDTTALVWDVTGLHGTPVMRLSAADLQSYWKALASADAPRAYQAIWVVAAVPRQSLPLVRDHLATARGPSAAHLARLIAGLDSNSFSTRQQATRELGKLGDAAEPAMRRALAGRPTPETRLRLRRLLNRLEGTVRDPEVLRRLRAVEVLEHVGTAEAQRILDDLARNAPPGRLQREAKASLGRLARRP